MSTMLIATAAHFRTCPNCKDHGHIMFADGRRSVELWSKEAALTIFNIACEQDLLQKDEHGELQRQIEYSTLPREASEFDFLIMLDARERHGNDIGAAILREQEESCLSEAVH